VVITVPHGYLKKNLIKFIPELSQDKQEAIQKIDFLKINKLFLEFETKFWGDEDYIVFLDMNLELGFKNFFNYNKVTGKNVLFSFMWDEVYESIKNKSEEELKEMIMKVLIPTYGENVKIKKVYLTKWNDDPFTYGAHSDPLAPAYLREKFTPPKED
jgi:monoamine oxidase